MALRNVMDYRTDDILRKKSKKVEKIDDKIVALLDDMVETMYHAKGIGLAAPQIGVLKRMIVIDIGEGIIKLINPEIVEMSGEQQEIEGCLSVPGVYGEVKRPQKVLIRALDQKGDEVDLDGTGLLACVFCHEIDHLEGILFIDKMSRHKS
ncbi:Peptide deformylase [Dehalobacter sp. UNSWDHB]|uniref:peptide deformylase n=1 Tax=Dehalobacter sp. UNSWDHB TaxID=1339256 RepID=UPI0003878FD9|nr:peptide deformylase [Dehalobacter sp. UNSWDHB]EQB22704.1 Peptide deformylase [Dehalobacter sp. UNSWDHB]